MLPLTAVVLSPVLFAEFIRLDDYRHLFENPQLRRMSLSGLAGIWTRSYFNLYIPVTYSMWWVLMVMGSLFGGVGQSAWLFHAFNLAVHLVNVALVFSIVRTLIRVGRHDPAARSEGLESGVALIAALFFALHPVQVESVAWVSELKGELAAMFGLLGLWWHYRSGRRLLVAALFVAAMLSKPSAIVFPGIVFLIDRIVLRKSFARSAVTPALYGVPLLILGFVTKHLQPDLNQHFIPTAAQRLIVAADAVGFYVAKVLVPFPLAVDYGRTPQVVLEHVSRLQSAVSAVLSLVGVALVVKALARPSPAADTQNDRWRSLVSCGWAIFVVSMWPVLGFITFGFQDLSTVANHYLYIPMFGVSVMVAGVLVRVGDVRNVARVAALPLAACAALSIQQAWLWRSTESLFTYTVRVNPKSYLGYFCLGDDLMRAGRVDEAIGWLEKSLAINPDYLNTVLTLGMAFTHNGEIGKSIDLYSAVLAKNPSVAGTRARYVASVHNNLGMLLLQSGNEEAGVGHLRQAIEIFPRSLNGHLNLGNVAFNEQRYAEAVAEYQTALALSPDDRGIEQRLEAARQRAQSP